MSRPRVSLLSHDNYDREQTLARVRDLLRPLGGMERFVSPGSRVLLKPNLVFGRDAGRAINTHPAILRAAAILAREAGAAWIGVGDSPGYGTARAAAKACGLLSVAEEEGLEMVEFTPVEDVDPGRSFMRLELAREVLEADAVINLPKMKTHGQMLMTLAVKNMFGAVPGARKLQWHYRAGRDRLLFARAINEIAVRTRPRLNILDAVVGMDELGPTAGRVRPVGFLGASDDPWALDAAVMDVLGLEPELLFTLADARVHGPSAWRDCERFGDDPESLRPRDWRIPALRTLQMHGGFIEKHIPWLAKRLRRIVSPRPVPKASCIACGHCVDICPAKAMRIDNGRLLIDEAQCIRCFCCHELCQHDGMNVTGGGLLGRLPGIS
ncbi:MAG: DUF362 domain-containing protein [Planctomycetota bacterium]|jgi:uncharacterized protein (DUF362 family)/NAD-dependent dihydropyrimidine dehydrogenase PreA subunit|nr:DUF362 domain-containing protein [Planctomycetota bacterium]